MGCSKESGDEGSVGRKLLVHLEELNLEFVECENHMEKI